jgi:uncharacterized metal-binding protein YceD (DUF177 family)
LFEHVEQLAKLIEIRQLSKRRPCGGRNKDLVFIRLIFNFALFFVGREVLMYSAKQFIIPVTGLKPGSHRYEFEIEDSFFEHFEYSEIKKGLIHVGLVIEKEETVLNFHFVIRGMVNVPCDRCYELFDLPVEAINFLIVKFGTEYTEESEDVQVVPVGENQFDIQPFIYEYIHLALPVRRVHPDDEQGNSTCDPDVIRRLEDVDSPSAPDPRWDALLQLKKKNKS